MAPLTIVSRAQWGARYARGFGPAPLPAQEVWLHHSVTAAPPDDSAREIAAMHVLEDIGQDRFGGGISYTFAVMPSGRVYEGHGVDREGAHTANRNSIARAIVLVGNYDEQRVTDAQIHAIAALLQHGRRHGWWRNQRLDGGHQQAPGAQTACPGRNAMAVIGRINLLAGGIPVGDIPGEDEEDMARFLKGDSNTPIPGSDNTYGDVVFKVEYDHEFGSIAVRTRVPNPREPGFLAFLATGGKVHQVSQAILDAIPDKATARDQEEPKAEDAEKADWSAFWTDTHAR